MNAALIHAAEHLAGAAAKSEQVSDVEAVGETVCFTILGERFCAVVEYDEAAPGGEDR